MKKLIKEQKARAYDEAVCKMKEIITMDNTPTIPREIGEYLFPELRESEDVRIRKEIIYHIQNCDDTIDEETEKKMIAKQLLLFLENPKEYNPDAILEQPEPYFYCKYGGTMPLCSDCKRNHNNSSFKTEEITTWYAPSNGTKHCIDYIQQKQPEVDLEKEINNCFPKSYFENGVRINFDDVVDMAYHFYELGLNARKEE